MLVLYCDIRYGMAPIWHSSTITIAHDHTSDLLVKRSLSNVTHTLGLNFVILGSTRVLVGTRSTKRAACKTSRILTVCHFELEVAVGGRYYIYIHIIGVIIRS